MTQYKIQVGSWTKLPNGKVQDDTRAIMEMMADNVDSRVERYNPIIGYKWDYIGIKGNEVSVYDETRFNTPALFIPYEELQKMLNEPKVQAQNVPSSLLNTKLDCRKSDGTVDEGLSRAFQEACFEQGIPHGSILKGRKFLFNTEGHCGVTWGDSESGFDNHGNKQINFKYSRKLEWEATEVPTKVEPEAEEDKMVDICGVLCSAKELSEAIALIKSARK